MAKSIKCVLKNVRLSFPKVFVPEEYMGKTRYSVQCVMAADDTENVDKLNKAIEQAVESAFPGKTEAKIKQFRGSKTTWPIKQLDDGFIAVSPKRDETKGAPVVVDKKKQIIPASDSMNKVYGGVYANVLIDVYCYATNGGGVTTYLNGIQSLETGAPFGGAPTATQIVNEFDDVSDTGAEDDNSDLF